MRNKLTARLAALVTGAALAVAGLTGLATSPAAATGKNCEAYSYYPSGRNLCDKFDGHKDVNCPEVKYQVKLRHSGIDPWGLDGSRSKGDGYGCEGNPPCPSTSPSPSHSQSHSPSTSPSASHSASASPSASTTTKPPTTTAPTTAVPTTAVPSHSATAAAGNQLPKTGPTGGIAVGIAALLLVAGGGVFWAASRRRRVRFTA